MKTIKINKQASPRTRIGIEDGKLYQGTDVNGGPAKGGSVKWSNTLLLN